MKSRIATNSSSGTASLYKHVFFPTFHTNDRILIRFNHFWFTSGAIKITSVIFATEPHFTLPPVVITLSLVRKQHGYISDPTLWAASGLIQTLRQPTCVIVRQSEYPKLLLRLRINFITVDSPDCNRIIPGYFASHHFCNLSGCGHRSVDDTRNRCILRGFSFLHVGLPGDLSLPHMFSSPTLSGKKSIPSLGFWSCRCWSNTAPSPMTSSATYLLSKLLHLREVFCQLIPLKFLTIFFSALLCTLVQVFRNYWKIYFLFG